MIDRITWAADLTTMADRLDAVTTQQLRDDEALHDEIQLLIHRYASEDDSVGQYPPEWDNLLAAVEPVSPNVLLNTMWGWVAVGRWMDAPLAEIHDKGWLLPALRKLAAGVDELDLAEGVDY